MSHHQPHNQHFTPNERTSYAISDAEARQWALYCHLATFTSIPFLGVFITFIIWLLKKDLHPFVEQQGREALNYQISFTIYMILCIPLMIILIGIPMFIIIGITSIILTIIACVTVSKGQPYRYPAIIRFF